MTEFQPVETNLNNNQPAKKSKKFKWVLMILGFILILVVFFFVYKNYTKISVKTYDKFTNSGQKLSIDYPKGWEQIGSDDKQVIFALFQKDYSQGVYNSDVNFQFHIINKPYDIKNFPASSGEVIISEKNVKIGNISATERDLSMDSGDKKVKTKIVYFVHNNKTYIIDFSEEFLKKIKDPETVINHILNSIKLD